MIVIYSKNKVPIRMSQERWRHIAERHPELKTEKNKLVETIEDPDFLLQGDFGEVLAARFYKNTSLGAKYLVVAYKEIETNDGFILTAYLTNVLSRKRSILWKR